MNSYFYFYSFIFFNFCKTQFTSYGNGSSFESSHLQTCQLAKIELCTYFTRKKILKLNYFHLNFFWLLSLNFAIFSLKIIVTFEFSQDILCSEM